MKDLEARVVLILQALRPGQEGRLRLSGPLRLPHRDHQHPDHCHGRYPCDVPTQAAEHRPVGNVPIDRYRVPSPLPDARPAEGFSQVAILRALASVEASSSRAGAAAVVAARARPTGRVPADRGRSGGGEACTARRRCSSRGFIAFLSSLRQPSSAASTRTLPRPRPVGQ